MIKLKNKQMLLHCKASTLKVFLKFSYLVLFVLFSCGNGDTAKKTTTNAEVKTETKTTEKSSSKTIVFFGDSLTAGYGLEDVNDAYPGLIQDKIDSLSLAYTVVNSGVSGETTAGGKSRIDWVLKNQKADIFVLELGANDGLRGVPLQETKENLQAIIDVVLAKNPATKIVITGMQLPPNMGIDYTTEFKTIFPELAKKNQLELIPFLLENVGGIPSLNQGDGIHPTAEGHQILAKNVWDVLKPIIL